MAVGADHAVVIRWLSYWRVSINATAAGSGEELVIYGLEAGRTNSSQLGVARTLHRWIIHLLATGSSSSASYPTSLCQRQHAALVSRWSRTPSRRLGSGRRRAGSTSCGGSRNRRCCLPWAVSTLCSIWAAVIMVAVVMRGVPHLMLILITGRKGAAEEGGGQQEEQARTDFGNRGIHRFARS